MSKELTKIFSNNLWIDERYDLRCHQNTQVVGTVSPGSFKSDFVKATLYRPRRPSPPGAHQKTLDSAPPQLKYLYAVAANDMRAQGLDPDKYYMYSLYQNGPINPDHCLREGFWHFDLMRLLRAKGPSQKIPVSISYAVSNALSTIYLTQLKSDKPLYAKKTIMNKENHTRLATRSLLDGYIFKPQAGEIVRYDNLTLHRGAPNNTGNLVHRTFMHIGFCPIP